MLNKKIFREYDIRGIAGDDLTQETAFAIGRAFGIFLKKRDPGAEMVSVGRDVRLSSEYLSAALIEGITSTGIDVYDIGICPTPLQYFSIFYLDLDGGIMVTGSHNPPEYNGFKISIGRETVHGMDIQKIREIAEEEVNTGPQQNKASSRVTHYDITRAYKDYMVKEFLYLNNARYRKLKVVVDAGNGTAGLVVPDILGKIGCDVIPIYCEPDGSFPNHHPDPTVVEYMQALIKETRNSGADVGIGYDGDADRLGVVNRDGDIVWGDQVMIVLSREILRGNPGAKIIGDVKCSQLLFDDIKACGGIPVMWKTGHSLVKQKMREEGALLAGEFSGHIFIADRYFGYDDAIYTTLRLVEIIKTRGKDIKDLLSGVPKMFCTPEIRIDCADETKRGVVERVVSNFLRYKEEGSCPCGIVDVNTTDGIRVVFERGWGLVRTSNTQPVIVIRAEAEDDERLGAYRSFLEEELEKAKAGCGASYKSLP